MIDRFNPILTKLFAYGFLVFSVLVNANELKDHPSPYLALHANDPVDWHTWGKPVLQRAREENKLIYLSIGYFSCHWCHVMQKESYADQAVGDYLNEHFIAVKVDRELRPELDRRMIRFVEQVRGQAGWPLNVFITADGYPVSGFTYLPRDNFYQVLQQLQGQWQKRQAEIEVIAGEYFKQTESSETRSILVELPAQHYVKVVDAFVSQAMTLADELQGGFGNTTKFPSYPQLNALLTEIRMNPKLDTDVSDFMRLTLDTMASRHLMDHVNSGFFRYVTDPDWQTPHYEKMLYDNAQLAQLYFDAEEIWPGLGYAQVGLKTIAFMLEFLGDDSGGFNASLSAVDEHNIEGAAYLWNLKQIRKVLNEKEFEYFKQYWNQPPDESSDFQPSPVANDLKGQDFDSMQQSILQKLRSAPRPIMPVDHKKLASWNALALKALLKAEKFTKEENFKRHADKLKTYMQQQFLGDGQVVRFAGASQAAETTLMDNAQLAHALQHYALSRGDDELEGKVIDLINQTFDRYLVGGRWIQDTESLIPGDEGEWIVQDAVLESPVSLLLETVFLLEQPAQDLKKQAQKLMFRLTRDVLDVPYHYASAIMLRKQYQPAPDNSAADN